MTDIPPDESGGVPKPCPKCGKIDCKTVHQDGPDE